MLMTSAPSNAEPPEMPPVAGSVAPDPASEVAVSAVAGVLSGDCGADGAGVVDGDAVTVAEGVGTGVDGEGEGEGMGAEFSATTRARYSAPTSVQ
jgi:hypothetical protein